MTYGRYKTYKKMFYTYTCKQSNKKYIINIKIIILLIILIKILYYSGGGGSDFRPVIHYRDLDAPREPDEFL